MLKRILKVIRLKFLQKNVILSAQEYRRRGEGRQNDMGRAEDDLPEPRPLEESCGDSLFPKESRGISQFCRKIQKIKTFLKTYA